MKFPSILIWIGLTVLIPFAMADVDAVYLADQQSVFQLGQRSQQQLGATTGYMISDLEYATLISPYFEIGLRLRLLARYGGVIGSSFAAIGATTGAIPSNSATTDNSFSFGGYDRPMIRARQLAYGNFKYGRWYLVDLGIGVFNTAGYTAELFRYWSSRVGMHESLKSKIIDPQFELALTLRSLTQFAQPSNLGLIYPPTIDGLIGAKKDLWNKVGIAADFKFEQALVDTQIAGSYNVNTTPPLGAPTHFVFDASTSFRFSDNNQIIFSYANRIFRWPDNDSSALWEFFEEGYYGQSYAIAWRTQW